MLTDEQYELIEAVEEATVFSAPLPDFDILRQLRLETYAALQDMSRSLPFYIRRCRVGLEHIDDALRDFLLGDQPASQEPYPLDSAWLAKINELVRLSSPVWSVFLLAGSGRDGARAFVRETYFTSEWVNEVTLDRFIDHVLDMLAPERSA